ncbi:MAG: hypothetical protein K9K40_06645 [Desulfotignum sp.]|nr:hypothetical protein [Desulfotignum sp.]MCF8092123.1 hypothetical protein [Desulfotignum sp.]
MRFIKKIVYELLSLFAFCIAFFIFIELSDAPISRWFAYAWIGVWWIFGFIGIIAVLVAYRKDIIKFFHNDWVIGILIFFIWGGVWYYVCVLIEKLSGFSHETTFFFTLMPSFGVVGYFLGKFIDSSK